MLLNLRVGFATNSSSSHSVVLMKTPPANCPSSNWGENDFGWDNFTLSGVEDKMAYVAVDRRQEYDSWNKFFEDFGDYVPEKRLHAIYGNDGYIDHQSTGTTGKLPLDVFTDPRVVILGGNDNSDGHPLADCGIDMSMQQDYIERVDGDARVFFFPKVGIKFRLGPNDYTKSTTPELVDVKITDYCPYGCEFCYQGSTKNGKHAPVETIEKIAAELGRLGVFEVALGGGEPLMHPDFPRIVNAFINNGVVPNATAFGVEWLRRPEIVEAVKRLGGLGVSIHSADDYDKFVDIHKAIGFNKTLPQHVFGSLNYAETKRLLEKFSYHSLLLLGFKRVGRGYGHPEHKFTDSELHSLIDRCHYLSVDTAFNEEYPNAGFDEKLVSSPEGKFSCYIDAVTERIAPSSYCDEDKYLPLRLGHINEDFARF